MGSRLQATLPKLLVPVLGRPMLEWLVDLYRSYVDLIVVVVHPSAERHVRAFGAGLGITLRYALQREPTGMLDAILAPRDIIAATDASHIWVTWCDQVAVHPNTVARLAAFTSEHADAALILPTARRPDPYIHLLRDETGRIVRVLHRREGDDMPAAGESDIGLFSLSRRAYLHRLHAYAERATTGDATGERNFLPFIPEAARTDTIVTFPCEDAMEAVGVNTPEELAVVSQYLSRRAAVD